jgi:hypothetical protein
MNPLSHYLGSQIPRQSSFVSHRVDTPAPRRRVLLALLAAVALAVLALPTGAFAASRVDHFAVTVSPRTPAAGQDITITATAKDASNATVKDYDGTMTFSDSSGTLSASDQGKWTSGVSATTAKVNVGVRGDVVTVQTADGISGKSAAFNVTGPADHLAVTVSPRTPTVGQNITITTTAKDANNLTVTSYAAKTTTVKDSSGKISASEPGQFANGVSTTTATVGSAVHGDVIDVEDDDQLTGQSAAFNVMGAVDHLSLSAPSSVDASGPFDVIARALDAAGNPVTDYNGPASWSDSAGVLSPSAPADFVAGVSKTSARVSSPTNGDVITLTAGGLSAQRKLSARGAFDHLDVRVPGSVAVGAPFTLTATARDAVGNVVTSGAPSDFQLYDGALSNGFRAIAPFTNGVSKTTISFEFAVKAHQIGVIDFGQPKVYLSSPINAIGPVTRTVLTYFRRTDGSASCESVKGTLTVAAADAAGNIVTNYNASSLTWSTSGSLNPAQPAPFVHGVSTTSFTLVNPNYFMGGDVLNLQNTDIQYGPVTAIRLC